MAADINGRRYSYVIGSDLVRDGMYLELSDETKEPTDILEIFYSDQTHTMTMTAFRENIPIEVVEWALQQARARLPSSAD
ncbi:MAG: hypothetical protein GKS00_16910 [Alphaproteobacteria bacterium]|nr:hypothetical protein [Alphaproteobacteria bacterium]